MKSLAKHLTLLLAGSMLLLPSSEAAVLAQYTFTGASPVSTDTDPNGTASNFNVSGGSYPVDSSTSGFSSLSSSVFIRSSVLTNTESGAISGNDYFSFTLTPNAGVTYNLSSLDLNFGGNSDGTTFGVGAFLRTSLNGYGTNSITPISISQTVSTTGTTYGAFSFDLSSLGSVTSAVTFRLYLTSDSVSNAHILRGDDIVLNGTAAVPEPSTVALGLAGVLGLAALSRLRRKD